MARAGFPAYYGRHDADSTPVTREGWLPGWVVGISNAPLVQHLRTRAFRATALICQLPDMMCMVTLYVLYSFIPAVRRDSKIRSEIVRDSSYPWMSQLIAVSSGGFFGRGGRGLVRIYR